MHTPAAAASVSCCAGAYHPIAFGRLVHRIEHWVVNHEHSNVAWISLTGTVLGAPSLRLQQQLPEKEAGNVSVIAFAAPAVGNVALARSVKEAGWADCFVNFLLPGALNCQTCIWCWP